MNVSTPRILHPDATDAPIDWPVSRGRRALREDEVRVWRAPLDLEARTVERLAGFLSGDERDRARRYHFQRDGTRFVVSRAALRTILAGCLGVAPETIQIRYEPNGKPGLAPPFDRSGLSFNVSHSDDVGLIAVTRGRRVGVDIERLRPLPDLDALAERVFSRAERWALRRLPPAERLEGFFRCWTRKEAYVKAIGTGLAGSTTRFTVSLAPEAPARLEHVDGDADAPKAWCLEAMAPGPGSLAALAAESRSAIRLTCCSWREADW